MYNRIYKHVGFIAGILTIISVAYTVIGHLKSTPIPLWLYLTSVIIAFSAGLAIMYRVTLSKNFKRETLKLIDYISFDYLPDSPKKHGWILQVDNNGSDPTITAAYDSPTKEGIQISSNFRYALDYNVEQAYSLANLIELYAKFKQNSCFYVRVNLSSRDGRKTQQAWLAHIIGQGSPRKAYETEYKVPVQGQILEKGWVQLKLPIEDEILKTFGKDGWVFQELIGFRIRGSISISSIGLYRIG